MLFRFVGEDSMPQSGTLPGSIRSWLCGGHPLKMYFSIEKNGDGDQQNFPTTVCFDNAGRVINNTQIGNER